MSGNPFDTDLKYKVTERFLPDNYGSPLGLYGSNVDKKLCEEYVRCFDEPAAKGIKYDTNKPNTALLPPLSLLGASRVLGMGASKYGPDNWRGGIEYRRLLGAALRHILAYSSGEDTDPESGLSHIHHATVNLMFLGEFIEEGRTELDDRYKSTPRV